MDFECVVVGGGVAGLSAALTLGRARRRTLLLDVGGQSNRATAHAQGLFGFDGVAPAELYERGRAQLAPYDAVTVEDVAATSARAAGGGFAVGLADGREVTTSTLLLATGMDYELPDVPGFAEGWGGAVFHCPFCHGWEVRDGKLAVYAMGEAAQHLEPLLRGWSDDVTVLDPRTVERLRYAPGGGTLRAAVLKDGGEVACDAILTHTPLRRRGTWAEDLGLDLTELGMVKADAFGTTSVPGVFAAGDLAVMPSLPQAVTTGQMAAVGIVRRLLVDA